MNSSTIKGIVIGGAIALAVGAAGITGFKTMLKPTSAEVLAVKEVKESIKTPHEECADVQVSKQAPVKDENRIAGTVVGGVIGGLLGNQVGAGRGKTVATVAGAAAGGYAGNKVQQNIQDKDRVTSIERRCKTTHTTSTKTIGYDVTYRLDGKQDIVRMTYNPGKQIPVKDGQLVLDEPEAGK
jgi:uncharacterized protein YcfJ